MSEQKNNPISGEAQHQGEADALDAGLRAGLAGWWVVNHWTYHSANDEVTAPLFFDGDQPAAEQHVRRHLTTDQSFVLWPLAAWLEDHAYMWPAPAAQESEG